MSNVGEDNLTIYMLVEDFAAGRCSSDSMDIES